MGISTRFGASVESSGKTSVGEMTSSVAGSSIAGTVVSVTIAVSICAISVCIALSDAGLDPGRMEQDTRKMVNPVMAIIEMVNFFI